MVENPATFASTDDIRGMIKDTVNQAVAQAMAEVKSLLEQTATKADVKTLQDQIDAHQKAIATHDGRIEAQKQRIDEETTRLNLFKTAIEEITGRMENSVASAVTLLNQRDELYQKRMTALDDRLTSSEKRTAVLADNLHEVELADADTRKRLEEVIPPLQKEMFGDPVHKRPGVITTLETTNARIDAMGSGFEAKLGIMLVSLNPIIETHAAAAARKQRWQNRRRYAASLIFSKRGMALIGASLPITVPWAVNWIQAHINLHPALLDALNQFGKIISLYAGK